MSSKIDLYFPSVYELIWVSLLHLVHTSNLWPNIKVWSKSIEIYYIWYFYVLVLTTHNRKGLEGIPQH